MENIIFSELGLSPELQKALDEMGFEEATPIQSGAIPHVLAGKDVLGQAQTGTGKTCAFGIPAIERLDPNVSGVQVLILLPTRELAIQVSDELKKVSKYKKDVKVVPIYGGQSIDRQIFLLKSKPQIIVGTPGRVMDHMRRRTLKLNGLKMIILDEADEMLNMGFKEDIDTILSDAPDDDRQTLLFSATIPPAIKDIMRAYQKDPVHVRTLHKELSAPLIDQYYIEVRESGKLDVLSRFIDANNIKLALIFCNTKRRVDELTEKLQGRGYAVDALHGDMKQSERDRVMNKFRKGTINFLVATDVAARGIDVNNVEAVFNYDIPNDEEYYVHRIGRTGRAGKSGAAYSFVFGKEIYKLKDIQRYTKTNITQIKPPSVADIEGNMMGVAVDKVKAVLEQGKHGKYATYIERVLKEYADIDDSVNSLDVAAALFLMKFEETFRDYGDEVFEREIARGNSNMVRLFVNVGSMDSIQPGNLVQGIASKTSLSGKAIGSIEIHRNFSFVDVPMEFADEVVDTMAQVGFTHRGRKVSFEKASKRQRPKRDNRAAGDRKYRR